jgi:hypothetical protein
MGKAKDPIFTAFNLGVIARQEKQFATVKAASNYFYDVIYTDLSRQYKGFIDEGLILSYADYLTSIALLGYILPHICAYDEGFKNKLMDLILTKIRRPREVDEFEELRRQKGSAIKERYVPTQVY